MDPRPMSPHTLSIDRLIAELQALAQISEAEPPVVTRIVFSEADMRARAYVKGLCSEAGLTVREDAIGNTFARWHGTEPDLAPIGTGSHIDAIPNAGLYDGCVGVLGGLEAIRVLQRARLQAAPLDRTRHLHRRGANPLRHRLPRQPHDGQRAHARRRRSLCATRRAAASKSCATQPDSPARSNPLRCPLAASTSSSSCTSSRVRILEQEGIDLGLVTHIAAPASLRIVIEGEGGHAGGKLMPGRKDALAAAAELILALEAAAKSTGAIDTVGTVGVCEVFPGAVNSIPSRVRLETDIRDIDGARREACSTR